MPERDTRKCLRRNGRDSEPKCVSDSAAEEGLATEAAEEVLAIEAADDNMS